MIPLLVNVCVLKLAFAPPTQKAEEPSFILIVFAFGYDMRALLAVKTPVEAPILTVLHDPPIVIVVGVANNVSDALLLSMLHVDPNVAVVVDSCNTCVLADPAVKA